MLFLGLCSGHAPSQELVGETMIPIVHKLEHMSSNTQIGSLAENLMEVLCQNDKVSEQVRLAYLPLSSLLSYHTFAIWVMRAIDHA